MTGITVNLSSGVVAQYLGTTRGLALGLFVFCLVLALLVEAFGRGPATPRDFGGVVFRAVVVLLLLTFYSKLFGSLFGLAEGIARRVAPQNVWDQFTTAQTHWMDAVQRDANGSTLKSLPGWGAGYVFDALVALALLVGQVSLFLVNTFGRVLAALLYVIGPLALVFSIPRGVATGPNWFRVFAGVLCWPTLSGLLVSLTVAFGLQTNQGGQGAGVAFESVAIAGLMAVISCAVPLVATAIVGAGFETIATGWQALTSVSPVLASLGAGAVGAAGAAGHAVRRVGRAGGAVAGGVAGGLLAGSAGPLAGAGVARSAIAGAWRRVHPAGGGVAPRPMANASASSAEGDA